MDDLVEHRIAVAGLDVTLFRPADAEALIDEDAFADDEFLPYWAELWPSGVALAHAVAHLEIEGARVLELGSGLGLPALVAAARGASVVATDWSPAAVELLAHNARANGVDVRGAVVRWADPTALAGERFELVLAADVLYERRNTPLLLAALARFLLPEGEALVVDPGRRHAAGFVDAARAEGWRLEASSVPDLPRGSLYRLRR